MVPSLSLRQSDEKLPDFNAFRTFTLTFHSIKHYFVLCISRAALLLCISQLCLELNGTDLEIRRNEYERRTWKSGEREMKTWKRGETEMKTWKSGEREMKTWKRRKEELYLCKNVPGESKCELPLSRFTLLLVR